MSIPPFCFRSQGGAFIIAIHDEKPKFFQEVISSPSNKEWMNECMNLILEDYPKTHE